MRSRVFSSVVWLSVFGLWAAGASNADDATAKPDAEASALAFAGEHHPELKTLVESLKTANPDGYKKAVHDLHKASERFAKLKEKNPSRSAHELALWSIDSRIRLTAARGAMSDSQEQRAELRSLLEQRSSLHQIWLKEERERAKTRVSKIDAELHTLQSKTPEAIEAEVDRLLKSVKTKNPRLTNNKKKGKSELPTTPPEEPPTSTPDPTPP